MSTATIAVRRTAIGPIIRAHRSSIALTYLLLVTENALRLAQPFALGWAIDDLLGGRWLGLYILVAQHMAYTAISLSRKVYDTLAFNRIYTDIATRVAHQHRRSGAGVSTTAARTQLSREFVTFLEQSVPQLVWAGFSIIGAALMLAWYDPLCAVLAVTLLAPAAYFNRRYGRRIRRLNRDLHDELEREVDVIHQAGPEQLREHFDALAHRRWQLSNAEALNFGLIECFVLPAIIVVLMRACAISDQAGDIFAIFRYLMLALAGLDRIPQVVQQFSRMLDTHRRLCEPRPSIATH
ncbi:MAG: hypothetical protein D6725_09375 [Planctomycetota bacterium]|nr:MAG: hypothetical protein D6725_09375 [Planctomycetota bacterium]